MQDNDEDAELRRGTRRLTFDKGGRGQVLSPQQQGKSQKPIRQISMIGSDEYDS